MKHTQFENGFQIIYEKLNSTIPISSVQIICNVGNIHSPPGLNGVTHFIEHMCFKGTRYHPDFNKVIMQYVDSGSVFNGLSTQRYTAYVVKCQDIFLPQCIKIMAEELLQSKFDLTEFKKEEKVVTEETIIDNDNPKHVLQNMADFKKQSFNTDVIGQVIYFELLRYNKMLKIIFEKKYQNPIQQNLLQ